MCLRQFDRLDRDLAQRMRVESCDYVPDVMGLPNPHHHVVGIVLHFDLAIVVWVEPHRIEMIKIFVAKRVFGQFTERFCVGDRLQVAFLNHRHDRWIFGRESQ